VKQVLVVIGSLGQSAARGSGQLPGASVLHGTDTTAVTILGGFLLVLGPIRLPVHPLQAGGDRGELIKCRRCLDDNH